MSLVYCQTAFDVALPDKLYNHIVLYLSHLRLCKIWDIYWKLQGQAMIRVSSFVIHCESSVLSQLEL